MWTRFGRGMTVIALVTGSMVAIPSMAASVPAGRSEVRADFNGDGFADLAVSASGESLGPGTRALHAGAVHVMYGSENGLSSTDSQFWTQDSPGIVGDAAEGEFFGSALAVADLNGDGFADLAVGVQGERVATNPDPFLSGAGGVNVIYGSAGGLTAAGNQFWSQDTAGVAGTAELGDAFGEVLAAADVNGDGFADLAVGVPGEDIAAVGDAGGVNVIHGSAGGLTATGNQFWSQDTPGIAGAAERSDGFGAALAAGDFGGSPAADLAIGVPREQIGSIVRAGALTVVYGTANGLTSAGSRFWSQDTPGVPGASESDDGFGGRLLAADLGSTSHTDLVIAGSGESIGTVSKAGAVTVVYGSAGGLTAAGSQFWSQDSPGIPDAAEQEESFGRSLVAADFGNGPYLDLVVGVVEDIASVPAGGFHVIYGSANGLTSAGSQLWSPDSPGVADIAAEADGLSGVAAADFGADDFADLAVGVVGKDLGPLNSGAMIVLNGSAAGLTPVNAQFWSQDSPGIADTAEELDYFGGPAVAAG